MGQVQDSQEMEEDKRIDKRDAENQQKTQQMLESSDAQYGNPMAKHEALKRQKAMQEQNPMDCENEQTLQQRGKPREDDQQLSDSMVQTQLDFIKQTMEQLTKGE